MAVDFPDLPRNMITAPRFCAAGALLYWTTADAAGACRLSGSAISCDKPADDMPSIKVNNFIKLPRALGTAAGARLRQP